MVLFPSINKFANPHTGPGVSRRRRLFIPPSTNYPLFSYGEGDDQRSFLSLIENGSVYTDEGDDVASEVASVSTSRSLPSTLSSANDGQESFHSWLLEEHQRRYSAVNSEDEDYGEEERRSKPGTEEDAQSLSDLEDFANLHTNYKIEMKLLARYSFPLIITFLLEHLFSIVSLLVVGHLGKNELAAVSLGSMCTTVTFAIFEGIATALDTLCPQAYGAGNFDLVSIHVQRCTVFSWIIFIPCALLWWYSGFFLKYIIENDQVSQLTVNYLRIMVFGAPAYIFFENFKRFLQAQGIFEAGTGVLFLSAPINIGLSYWLVWNTEFGFYGSPVATIINFWLMVILLILYVALIDGKKCWFGFKLNESFHQWGNLSHLAIPGIVMLESEYLAYEIMTLFASYFGTSQLAAQSAVASIASLTYMIPFAVSIASSTRIANFIGGQNMILAQIATKTGLYSAIIVASFNCIILYTFKNQIGSLFSSDEEVIQLVISLFNPLVSILQIFDGIALVASGILRAQGLQKIGGVINFLAYYAFAMPFALVLTKFTDLELFGLWISIGSGMFFIALTETAVIITCDWEGIMMKAGILNDEYFETSSIE